MNIKKITVITLLVSGFVGAAFANDKMQVQTEGGKKPPMERMMKGDTDGDGAVSKAEWLAEAETKFSTIDADKDGKITRDELKSHFEAKRAERKAKREEWKAEHPDFGKEMKPAEAPKQ